MIRGFFQTLAAVIVVLAAVLLRAPSADAQAADKRAITFRDLIAMHRLSDPQISPDGQWVAYSVATPDYEANHLVKNIWIVAASGGEPRQLTHGGSDERARWSPDAHRLAYLSASDGTAAVFTIGLDGSSPVRNKQSEGAHRRKAALSTLECMVRWQAQPSVRGLGCRRSAPRSHSGRRLRCPTLQPRRLRSHRLLTR
jgi:hypothetical protein